MRRVAIRLTTVAVILSVGVAAFAATYSIPKDQLDPKKIYWGNASGFTKPAEVHYQEIIKETPEYKELKRKRIERGTGKYWILISQASDRAVRIVAQVGQESEYDLIAAEGYLGSLEPAIPADDITKLILKAMKKTKKSKKK